MAFFVAGPMAAIRRCLRDFFGSRSLARRSHMASTPLTLVRMSQSEVSRLLSAASGGLKERGGRIAMKGISRTSAPSFRNSAESAPAWWRARPTSTRIPSNERIPDFLTSLRDYAHRSVRATHSDYPSRLLGYGKAAPVDFFE